ncbi:MAG TPA: tRNA uridine-5-carboxymethylaminomethyl(34) synthesis GTPase MnmE [Candidatus Kapabacteria bacterium]|jgi:tRNA modification GTPase|nr:tRNA uridine-5-carboxymethylaminomethyl(34) synthesis GTPase MnmE [Candidatus Kapabacteria bacterium]
MRDWEGTIVARSTPLGHGAVGIVRLSGRDAVTIADRFVRVGSGSSLADLPARYLGGAVIERDGAAWDRCLVVRFEGPRSFTGEDVVELHVHGNPLIVDGVVDLAVSLGARRATSGEFTMRAVLNGKLDLLQAEAVGEAITAESEVAIRIAQRQLGGELSRAVAELRRRVIDAIARLELELDFAEEGYSFVAGDELRALVGDLRRQIESLLRSFRGGERLRTGPRVILLGRPNAGKSSFFNSVLGYSRALVSDVAGTTRDYLEERVVHGGLVIHLVDTAGLRSTEDLLEAEGVRRSWRLIGESDLALYLVDASDAEAVEASGRELAAFEEAYPDVRIERVWSKVDRVSAPPSGLRCSLVDPASVDAILDRIATLCARTQTGDAALVSQRQASILKEMESILADVQLEGGAELLSADLRRLLEPLGALSGDVSNEDVLDAVFGNFCIGK